MEFMYPLTRKQLKQLHIDSMNVEINGYINIYTNTISQYIINNARKGLTSAEYKGLVKDRTAQIVLKLQHRFPENEFQIIDVNEYITNIISYWE